MTKTASGEAQLRPHPLGQLADRLVRFRRMSRGKMEDVLQLREHVQPDIYAGIPGPLGEPVAIHTVLCRGGEYWHPPRPFLDRIDVQPGHWGCRRGVPGEDARDHGPAIERGLRLANQFVNGPSPERAATARL